MKERIAKVFEQVGLAVRSNPVELIICLFGFIICCLTYEKVITGWEGLPYYLPVFFLISYTLNQLSSYKFVSWIYGMSGLLVLPLVWSSEPREPWFYLISLGAVFGIYFISSGQRENRPFVESVLRFLRSSAFAALLSLVSWILIYSVYLSIQYIFEIWKDSNNRMEFYLLHFVYLLLFPLFFLYFHQDKRDLFTNNKVTDLLFNYVLSPVLLVYTAILYIYFVKIAVLWSLPKGGVALIVIFFSIALFVLKGCIPFVRKSYYAWFYNRASWIVLPALVMFWIGTVYRISQYGFTEDMVYLVVTGVVISLTTLLFFMHKWGRYLYVVTLIVVLFSTFTYIPGITAKDIEVFSQKDRVQNEVPEVKLPDNVFLKWDETVPTDSFRTVDIVNTVHMDYPKDYEIDSTRVNLNFDLDSISLFDKDKMLLFSMPTRDFLNKQLMKCGLTHNDTIDTTDGKGLLKVELDSMILILDNMVLSRDSLYRIENIEGGLLLKK